MQRADVLGRADHSIDYMHTSDSAGLYAAPDHNLKRTLQCHLQTVRLHSFQESLLAYIMGRVVKQAESEFIA